MAHTGYWPAEAVSPLASIKDRIAVAMVEAATPVSG
jgi:cysteine synthase